MSTSPTATIGAAVRPKPMPRPAWTMPAKKTIASTAARTPGSARRSNAGQPGVWRMFSGSQVASSGNAIRMKTITTMMRNIGNAALAM